MDSLPLRSRQGLQESSSLSPSSSTSPDDSGSQPSTGAGQQLKHTRTSTAKVRTGCVTCKKRHVKCDETKPFCMNCLRLKGFCEGYAIKPRKKRARPAPKKDQQAVVTAPRAGSPTILLEMNSNSLDFSDHSSMLYFDEFVDLAARYFPLSATYTRLWTVTLPQLARLNPSLRHAAIAIGALSKAHDRRDLPELPESQAARRTAVLRLREQSPHYHNAIVHYCAALRLQSQELSSTTVVQNTVFLSILFICFELIRGDTRSALRHINYGTALLYNVVTEGDAQDHITNLAPNPRYLLAEVADTYIHLATQSRTVLSGRIGRDMPLLGLSKDLSKRGTTVDKFFVVLQKLPRLDRSISLDSMPTIFRDAAEAEEYWLMVQRWGAEMGPILMEIFMESHLLELEDDDEINEAMIKLLGNPRMLDIAEGMTVHLRRWESAFRPLYDRYLMDEQTNRDTYLRILWLRMMWLITGIFNCIPRFSEYGLMEQLTPDCREMNMLAEMILRKTHGESTSPVHHLSLDGGVLSQISFVAFFCRDPLVREDAIRILATYPHKDGLWDSHAHLALAIRNRGIEKVNASEGDKFDQWLRLWRREHIFEDAGSRMLLHFMDRNPETGKWELVEEVADVKENVDDIVWTRQPLTGAGKFVMANILPLEVNLSNL